MEVGSSTETSSSRESSQASPSADDAKDFTAKADAANVGDQEADAKPEAQAQAPEPAPEAKAPAPQANAVAPGEWFDELPEADQKAILGDPAAGDAQAITATAEVVTSAEVAPDPYPAVTAAKDRFDAAQDNLNLALEHEREPDLTTARDHFKETAVGYQDALATQREQLQEVARFANVAGETELQANTQLQLQENRAESARVDAAVAEHPEVAQQIELDNILTEYQVADDAVTQWEPGGLVGLFTDPVTVTQTEANLLDKLSLGELKQFRDIRDQAFEDSTALYPGTSQVERNDGHQDAHRHAHWNALMTSHYGEDFAREFATAHEGLPGNNADREAMDLYNNEVGRRIAVENPDASDAELSELVHQAVENGEMVVIDANGDLAFSNGVAFGEHGIADDPPVDGRLQADPNVDPNSGNQSG